jgi:protein-S-isoprenylcysteine O-methyltransferase Ste14
MTIVLGSQILRSMAMIHASTNFSHMIAYRHQDGHVLVTHGIYRLVLSLSFPQLLTVCYQVGLDTHPTLVSFTGQ